MEAADESLKKLEKITEEARKVNKELSLVTQPKMKVVYNRIHQTESDYDFEDVMDDLGMFFTKPPTDRYKRIIESNIEVKQQH